MKNMQCMAAAMLLVVLGLQGCDKPEPVPAPSATNADAPVTPEPAPAQKDAGVETPEAAPGEEMAAIDAPALVQEIEGAEDFFAWATARDTYQALGKALPEVEEALSTRETALLRDHPPIPVNEHLEIVEFDWAIDGESAGTAERETFRASWVFKVNEPIVLPDRHDVRLVLRCSFDASHQQYFEEEKRDTELTFAINPPITTWEAGSYQSIEFTTYRKLPNIPYRIQTIFSLVKKDENDNWVYVERYGTAASHGWQASLGQEIPKDETPEAAAPANEDDPEGEVNETPEEAPSE